MSFDRSKPSIQVLGALAAVLLLTQCVPPNPTPAPSPTPSPAEASLPALTQRGIGDLEVGPSLSQTEIEESLGISLTPKNQDEFCGLSIAEDIGLAIVTDENTAALSFIIENPALKTSEGIGVGSTYDEVVAAYGDLVEILDSSSQTGGPIIAVDDMTRPGASLTMESRLLAFDTDSNRTVTRVRTGMYPWVAYTDYCSQETASTTHARTGWPLTRLMPSAE